MRVQEHRSTAVAGAMPASQAGTAAAALVALLLLCKTGLGGAADFERATNACDNPQRGCGCLGRCESIRLFDKKTRLLRGDEEQKLTPDLLQPAKPDWVDCFHWGGRSRDGACCSILCLSAFVPVYSAEATWRLLDAIGRPCACTYARVEVGGGPMLASTTFHVQLTQSFHFLRFLRSSAWLGQCHCIHHSPH